MILINDVQLCDIAFLSSDSAIEQLHKKGVLGHVFFSNLTRYIANYQPYIQRNLRKEDIVNQLLAFGYDKAGVTIQSVLSRLANTFLEWQGDHFDVKPHKLEHWLELLSLVDGSWIIAQAYTDIAQDYQIGGHDIIECVISRQCPHAFTNEELQKPYADNHVHLGGHGHIGPSLLSFALYGESLPNTGWPTRPEYTLFESGHYAKDSLPRWCDVLGGQLIERAFTSEASDTPIDTSVTQFEPSTQLGLYYLRTQGASNLAQKAFMSAHKRPIRSDRRWLLFCLGVLNTSAPNMAAQFVRVANVLRNYMVVWGTGLSQFVETSNFSARKQRNRPNQMTHMFDSLSADIEQSTFREFRIAPNLLLDKQAKLDSKILHLALSSAYKHALAENIHFVVHFSRSLKHHGIKRDDRYHKSLRAQIKQQVGALQRFKGSVTFSDQDVQTFDANRLLKAPQSIDLRKAIRGYDVAGNENDLPIEVFAPALRVIRSAKHPTVDIFSKRFQRPFLTVHAGEDFSHLLSGLRAVDEAVYFCDFKAGDRLGHALALGVIPTLWANRQRVAYVTLGDHVDNLVWGYQKALEVVQKAPRFTGVLHLLQEKINYWSGKLHEEDVYTTRTLYEAWKLRRNCPETLKLSTEHHAIPEVHALNPGYQHWVVDFNPKQTGSLSEKEMTLWRKYILAHVRQDAYYQLRKTPVIIDCLAKQSGEPYRVDEGRFYDSISAAELELFEAIQDLQMEKYAAQEIMIEACPTSNIYIGRFEHYHEHPIFRWDPPEQAWLNTGSKFNRFGLRKGAVPVCVNTDDAALMPTTIQNEHRVLQKSAVEHFEVGINKAQSWIEKIRETGMNTFLRNHLEWVNK
ncbi:antiviral RADAR system adenosine deaminase RdrB [Pseudoalteromonas sp. MMG012]|uniref:antiviral RADAR system adenosine deaminase RdrB n=1 Tax=Pseudoalteromonas sp. MMG012 TaxID=2822686 RepID=UPI001B39D83A|nr:antiviral RADAR system adenosine deaminase RdrB [Pseudoalteromonas sp. MMG012]MBQ4849889.1 hypothetical protein [Pseudoalteromonas sp. MMG012]